MRYNKLGQTDLNVSELCLGSMTWGSQNTVPEGHAQIDMSLDHGVNFLDVAEMYPSNPVTKETQGDSERVIGEWFAKSGRRKDVILATKVSGAGNKQVRDGAPISAETIKLGVAGSLERLQTDHIDIYQLHWPNRGSYAFRQNWTFDPTGQNKAEILAHMLEVLQAVQVEVDAGRISHFALSNESAWGTAQWLRLAEENNLPRVVSIQNEYSLLCRHFDLDMAELAHNEEVGLLSYSPLAAGILSGKYKPDVTPPKSRRSVTPDIGGRINPHLWTPLQAYLDLAKEHDLNPCHMALAWCRTRPFMASAIYGATSLEQLEVVLGSVEVELSQEVLDGIQAIYREYPAPM